MLEDREARLQERDLLRRSKGSSEDPCALPGRKAIEAPAKERNAWGAPDEQVQRRLVPLGRADPGLLGAPTKELLSGPERCSAVFRPWSSPPRRPVAARHVVREGKGPDSHLLRHRHPSLPVPERPTGVGEGLVRGSATRFVG